MICSKNAPDHATIARFQRRHFADGQAMADLFAQGAGAGGAGRAGAGRRGRDEDRSERVQGRQPRRAVAATADRADPGEAEVVDEAEDTLPGQARGDELPAGPADPRTRRERIAVALAQLEAERQAAVCQVASRQTASPGTRQSRIHAA
jgi:hypothetical protein